MSSSAAPPETDVIVVGHGPVGAALALFLARRGHRVTVLERRAEAGTLPRATSFDGETARLLAATGADLTGVGEAATGYDWRNAAGKPLVRLIFTASGRYGWPDATTMHQPRLEAALHERQRAHQKLTVCQGHTAVSIVDGRDRVEVTAENPDGATVTLSARWLVGCDGASSFVRKHLRSPVSDLGFSYDWLLCDVVPRTPVEFVPTNIQICDPARPTTLVGSGPGRRRYEFMRLPGETTTHLERPETVWRLLGEHGVTPETAELTRSAVYSFGSSWADRWRSGHVLLAGDAAHLMPPFAGQGMCSGIRDAANLAWKLDAVLGGVAGEQLLDTYPAERLGQVRESIAASVKLGRVICVTDPAVAADRDASMLARARGRPPASPEPAKPLARGLLAREPRSRPGAGEVIPQGRVTRGGRTALFDDAVGTGFVLLSTTDPRPALGPARRAALARWGCHLVQVLTAAAPADPAGLVLVADTEGVYQEFLKTHGVSAVLVRPDYHVFGAVITAAHLPALVDELLRLAHYRAA